MFAFYYKFITNLWIHYTNLNWIAIGVHMAGAKKECSFIEWEKSDLVTG